MQKSPCPYAHLVAEVPSGAGVVVDPAVADGAATGAAVGPTAGSDEVVSARPGSRCPAKRWGTRAGVAVFAFFLIKGLAWLVVPAAIAAFAMKGD